VSPRLIKQIKEAAGKRFGHEVEPRWDSVEERWVIYSFDQTTKRVDYPWIIVQNEDGTYRPLDDRVVLTVRECSPRSEQEWKKSREWYNRKWKMRKEHFGLMARLNYLRRVKTAMWKRGEPCEKINTMIAETTERLHSFETEQGREATRQLAKDIVKALKGRSVFSLS